MKIGPVPENLIEFILWATGAMPTPLIDTFQAIVRARAIMAGSKLGVFDALADGPATAAEVAQRIGADPRATGKLLNALTGAGYLRWKNDRYRLARVARKWLLSNCPCSLNDNMLHRYLEWDICGHFEDFVRTGKALDVHGGFPAEKWPVYLNGMRSLAGLSAGEVVRRLPAPAGARTMLDLGGAHGYYSVALCRRYPDLSATIIDLPDAVQAAAAILARENMGSRVVHRADNVLTADLGKDQWDLVFASQLLHHFDAESNRQLLQRVARALRPGGIVAILEVIRPSSPRSAGQTGTLLDLFFAVTSLSGTWSQAELAGWQQEAGLTPLKPIRLRTIPGAWIQAAQKG
ncbi:MAG TPA: class I SAM-dependent methyltransferase [Gemmataceae bacterium]|nr:class I SAM-dependent methyltransferase [Gemmataceae bacterium]